MHNQNRIKILAWVIIIYVIAFIAWWSILLIRTETQNFKTQKELIQIYNVGSVEDIEQQFSRNKKMIIYEGVAFLSLLIIASLFVFRLIKRQSKFIEQKRNFLLATTHELNTPLTSIKLNLQTIENPEITAPDKDQLIHNSKEEINRLQQLIKNILFASKLDSKEDILHQEVVDFSAIVTKLSAKDYPLLYTEIEKDITVFADKSSLQIIVANLIDNALKYGEQQEIKIRLTTENGQAILSVFDQGIGISEADKQLIFNRFYRVEDERLRKTKGTGLGLFLVKEMAKLNRGMISVRDNKPNGSIFEFKIPIDA